MLGRLFSCPSALGAGRRQRDTPGLLNIPTELSVNVLHGIGIRATVFTAYKSWLQLFQLRHNDESLERAVDVKAAAYRVPLLSQRPTPSVIYLGMYHDAPRQLAHEAPLVQPCP